jgi:hypothetical protein
MRHQESSSVERRRRRRDVSLIGGNGCYIHDHGMERMRRRNNLYLILWMFLTTTMITAVGGKNVPFPNNITKHNNKQLRILYIVTTLAEYNTGDRATVKGSDRLQLTLIPVVREGVESMIRFGYHVDVYLICHYTLLPHRLQLLQAALPSSVKVDYWDDATPLGYSLEHDTNRTQHITRALARQHRFVIKEKLLQYDLFVNFEDDMLIKGDHVKQYLKVTKELYRLREQAPERLHHSDANEEEEEMQEGEESEEEATDSKEVNRRRHEAMNQYTGMMTKSQLRRMLPGWIRVEVLLEEDTYGAQTDTGPVPVNFTFHGQTITEDEVVDPQPCCHVQDKTVNVHMPASPNASKLFLWETGILALGVRQMPSPSSLDWVVLQRGPIQTGLHPNTIIGEYWSGEDGYFKHEKRPAGPKGLYVNNQGTIDCNNGRRRMGVTLRLFV